MKFQTLLLSAVMACMACQVYGKTVFRRTDNILENFKGLDLSPQEIDPNVAPPATHQQVATIDPELGLTNSPALVSPNDIVVEPVKGSPINQVTNDLNDVILSSAAAPVTPPSATTAETATTPIKKPNEPTGLGKYCKCTDSHCNCCRSIGLPILPVRSQGCAKIAYLGNEKMSVSLKYGDLTLVTRTISGRRAKPICVGLPGGVSEFCGRVYGLSKGKDDFKACLGFELRADDEVEAALRVSCFKFGPTGVRVSEAEPLPSEVERDEDDDGGYDDIFGFGGDDDDDNDYDADGNDEDAYNEEEDYAEDEDTETPEELDYGGFSLDSFLAELTDDDKITNINSGKPSEVTATTDSTRTGAGRQDILQNNDHRVNEVAPAKITNATDLSTASEVSIITSAITTAPSVTATLATTLSSNQIKRKKKTNGETDYTYEIINGILELFN